jgi:predicted DNA-binding transcriptional regulator AlpA
MTVKKTGDAAVGVAPDGALPQVVGELINGWVGICAEVHKSRVQLWRDIRNGRFPPPIETGGNSVAWIKSEVEAWKASRPRRTYRPIETPGAEQAA